MHLQNKTAVITGGCGAIGLALARELLKNGISKIALLDIDYDDARVQMLNDLFPRSEVIFHLTNVSKQHEIANAFQEIVARFKAIDLVITCAGILDEHNYKEMVDINLLGTIHTNYVAISHMNLKAGGRGGLIVNISSVAGIDCVQFSSPVYNATKHGVVAFTRSMGEQFYYEAYGIKFLTVCPGVTLTAFLEDLSSRLYSPEAYNITSNRLQDVPKQTVTEFASAFLDILEIEKNGSVWLIDGGQFKEIDIPGHWVKMI